MAENRGLLQTINHSCQCGFRFVGKANDTPHYCGRCGQRLKAGSCDAPDKLRVLLVDDSKLVRRVVGLLLKGMECEVTEAKNGQQAFREMMKRPFDLLLTDLVMPEMDGMRLIKIRRTTANSHLPRSRLHRRPPPDVPPKKSLCFKVIEPH